MLVTSVFRCFLILEKLVALLYFIGASYPSCRKKNDSPQSYGACLNCSWVFLFLVCVLWKILELVQGREGEAREVSSYLFSCTTWWENSSLSLGDVNMLEIWQKVKDFFLNIICSSCSIVSINRVRKHHTSVDLAPGGQSVQAGSEHEVRAVNFSISLRSTSLWMMGINAMYASIFYCLVCYRHC